MSEASESSRPLVRTSDTMTTGSSSDHEMEDVQESSPTIQTSPGTLRGSETSQARPGASSSTGRRRKVPDSVTPNACTNCKKARAKVSGRV